MCGPPHLAPPTPGPARPRTGRVARASPFWLPSVTNPVSTSDASDGGSTRPAGDQSAKLHQRRAATGGNATLRQWSRPPAQRCRGAAIVRRRAAVRRLRPACAHVPRQRLPWSTGVPARNNKGPEPRPEVRHAPEAQHPRDGARQARRLRLGRPVPARRAAERGGAAGPRRGARLRPGPAGAADPDGAPHRELRSGDHDRDGRPRPARPDHPRGLRRRRRLLRRLRPDRPRGRARRTQGSARR